MNLRERLQWPLLINETKGLVRDVAASIRSNWSYWLLSSNLFVPTIEARMSVLDYVHPLIGSTPVDGVDPNTSGGMIPSTVGTSFRVILADF